MAGSRRVAPWRKAVMAGVVTVAFFVVLEALLALVGLEPVRYAEDPYVGFAGTAPLFVATRAADGTEVMQTSPDKLRLFNPQSFPREKPAGTVRVFCMGGSTTFGHPYDDTTSFCGWLRELLPVADPSRQWELINAGGISYASYRVALLMEELSQYDPDVFVILSGHNEFLEKRTYASIIAMPPALRGVGALTARTRVHAAVKAAVDRARSRRVPAAQGSATVLNSEVTPVLDNVIGPADYHRDDEQRQRVVEHYRYNLARMGDIARAAGAEAVLVSPAANLADCAPFKSEHRPGLGADEQAVWERHAATVGEALRARDGRRAVEALAAATAIDGRYAHLHYVGGHVLELLGQYPNAKLAFERARDEDICPLRAPGEMLKVVGEVAAERQAPLVDFVALVEGRAPNGIPGDALFLDHVHPTVAGNRLLAQEIVTQMAAAGMVELAPGWNDAAIQAVATRVEGRLDSRAHGLALMKLSKVIGWSGKHQEAYRLAQQSIELAPDHAEAQYQAGLMADLLGRVDESIVHYRRALEINPAFDLPHGNLGVALEKKGDFVGAVREFRLAVQYGDERSLPRNRENLGNALHRLGAIALTEGRLQEAVTHLEEARPLQPGNVDLLIRLATAQVGLGQAAAGVTTFDQALALRPGDPDLLNRRATALYLAGRVDDAIAAYRQAVAADPRLAGSPNSLEGYLRRAGRTADADRVKAATRVGVD